MDTEERLEAIRERCEAATGGPWEFNHHAESVGFCSLSVKSQAGETVIGGCGCCGSPFGDNPDDPAFIAHARTDVPDLLAVAEAAREVVEADQRVERPDQYPAQVGPAIDRLREALENLEGGDR